jgi:hypothetical protein
MMVLKHRFRDFKVKSAHIADTRDRNSYNVYLLSIAIYRDKDIHIVHIMSLS